MNLRESRNLLYIGTAAFLAISWQACNAYSVWSVGTANTPPGGLIGLGNSRVAPAGNLAIHGVSFVSPVDMETWFTNSGKEPLSSVCSADLVRPTKGRLSNGARINENIDSCATQIGGQEVITAVAEEAPNEGGALMHISAQGDWVMSVTLALDFGGGKVVRVPVYSTTGELAVPPSLAKELAAHGQALASAGVWDGTHLKGRAGDSNGDGWWDGTFVAVATLPEDAPTAGGTSFVLYRHFDTDIPVSGVRSGNVKGLSARSLVTGTSDARIPNAKKHGGAGATPMAARK